MFDVQVIAVLLLRW